MYKRFSDRFIELVSDPQGGLPQGSPTSPFLSNLKMKSFDRDLFHYCSSHDFRFTRFADDITVSMIIHDRGAIYRLISYVEWRLAKEGLVLNKKPEKLKILRGHQAQQVCGVALNSGRMTVSTQKKRLFRAAKHRLLSGKAATKRIEQVRGFEAFVRMIEK